jgi:hypothetical protein
MRSTRLVIVVVSSLLLAALTGGVAGAAPGHAKGASTFLLTCDNGQIYTIVTNGNGDFTPGHIIDSGGGEVIPVAFDITVSLNGDVIEHDITVKPGQKHGLQGDVFTCRFSDSFTDPGTGDVFEIDGIVDVFLAPRH